jgi:hypothetical protein
LKNFNWEINAHGGFVCLLFSGVSLAPGKFLVFAWAELLMTNERLVKGERMVISPNPPVKKTVLFLFIVFVCASVY